ncbi:MAG: zinc ribbon domain-containing protein [Promethearchaeota archaeon]|nr:MAG: zinc ribbon domain-containing protein [Candidatus Lokiarchaeota archaeon]
MNIKKFNQVLSAKIAKAKSFENHGDIETAIELWLEISDLTLKASKQSDIEFTYRHMLINRTEQIIQHIKELKSPKQKEPMIENIIIEDEKIEDAPEIKKETFRKEDVVNKNNKLESIKDADRPQNQDSQKNNTIIEKSNPKNKSGGIKEIEAPKEFRIITPHDPNYVEKIKNLSEEEELNVFKKNKGATYSNEKEFDEKSICFACGAILPPKIKVCPECGTKLN